MPRIVFADNMHVLPAIPDGSVDLVYTDPPFNTGATQTRTRIRTARDDRGDRTGFARRRYRSETVGTTGFADRFDDYLAFLGPRLREAARILKPDGSLFLHVDYREVHYCKVFLDGLFGRESFMNEIIWAYDFGGRPSNRWPAKHDNILWYAKDSGNYTFDLEQVDRIPYMAPGLVGPERAARGKTPTDTWWHTIVPTSGAERTGYATQKPLGIVERIVRVHTRPGDLVLDCFAGSGTLGEAAGRLGRDFVLIDDNEAAIDVMSRRLAAYAPTLERAVPPAGSARRPG